MYALSCQAVLVTGLLIWGFASAGLTHGSIGSKYKLYKV